MGHVTVLTFVFYGLLALICLGLACAPALIEPLREVESLPEPEGRQFCSDVPLLPSGQVGGFATDPPAVSEPVRSDAGEGVGDASSSPSPATSDAPIRWLHRIPYQNVEARAFSDTEEVES